jgi:hypothetical protein
MNTKEHEKIKGENFIVFGEDFNRHPHALEHLMRPMFKDNQFIWVETIGLRSPKFSLYDLKRIVGVASKWITTTKKEKREIPANVFIVSPFMIPYTQLKIVRKFNKWQVKKGVNKILKTKKIESPITVASVLNACDFVGDFNEKLKVYYCVDEFSLWPGLDTKLVASFEKSILEKSDLTIVTSDTLAETKKRKKTPPVITHGVEFDHFNIGKKEFSDPFKICYYGLFDERSNQDIILAISEKIPNCEIHILGNVVCSVKKLKGKANIHFHGPVIYSELPKAIVQMDLFILPYYKNELTNFINPLKLKEYLSTGRPVVAIDLPEVIKLNDYLFVSKNSDEFVETINSIKNKKLSFDSEKITNFIKMNETWTAKNLIFSNLLRQKLSGQNKI